MINISLAGKTAIVTGGGQGLGAHICRTLKKADANIVVNYFKDDKGINQKKAEDVAGELGNNSIALDADVRSVEQVRNMIDKTISHFGKLDIIVNNAAVIHDRTIKKMSYAEWQDVIDTNLTGVFNVCKEAAEKIADEGRIVNLASIAAVMGFFGQSNYAAAKGGVVAMTRVLSKEFAKRKITVNAVAPGVVMTEMALTIPEERRTEMLKSIPLGRFGRPEDIANTILFLCSDLGCYITGQLIHVNGGWVG